MKTRPCRALRIHLIATILATTGLFAAPSPIIRFSNPLVLTPEGNQAFFVELKQDSCLTPAQTKDKKDSRTIQQRIDACPQIRKSLATEHQDFISALTTMSTAIGKSIKVRYDYTLAFNGLSVEMPPELLMSVSSMSDVASVYPVTKVTIPEKDFKKKVKMSHVVPTGTLYPALDVPQIWSTLNLKGDGTTIAIIDTGIDYTHPDLGGCLGAKCKVTGGYNFINNTADPMDDNGHGTHCAGIAAGNGKKLGVAPNASLVAYKVLDASGSGTEDVILTALEKAMDPNGDGSFKNFPQAINMSFGAAGSGTQDPLSKAVNQAGAITAIVVAAGNDWNNLPIGSPADAINSIAVGASQDDTSLASFSSIGPSSFFSFKPDIAAPGVGIWSTYLGGQYAQLDGTSMATPFISGMVALLSQQAGGKLSDAVDQVKARLGAAAKQLTINSADTSVLDNFLNEGKGVVQPLKTMQTVFPILQSRYTETITQLPGFATELGAFETSNPKLDQFIMIPIQAFGGVSKTYNVSITHDLGSKATVLVSPTTLTVSPGSMAEVYVSINANTSDIPANILYPGSRGALVSITDPTTGESLQIPISLFEKFKYTVAYQGTTADLFIGWLIPGVLAPPQLFFLHPNAANKDFEATEFLSPGPYALGMSGATQANGVITLNLFNTPSTQYNSDFTQTISMSDLPYTRTYRTQDPAGTISTTEPGMIFVTYLPGPNVAGLESTWDDELLGPIQRSIRSNALPDPWRVYLTAAWTENEKFLYVADQAVFSTVETVTLPEKWGQPVTLNAQFPGGAAPAYNCQIYGFLQPGSGTELGNIVPSMSNVIYGGQSSGTNAMALNSYFFKQMPTDENSLCQNPDLELDMGFGSDGTANLADDNNTPFLPLPNSVSLGTTLPILAGAMYKSAGSGITASTGEMTGNWGEIQYAPVAYTLETAAGATLDSGTTSSGYQYTLAGGQYKFTQSIDTPVNEQVVSTFTLLDSSAPTAESFENAPTIEKVTWVQETGDIHFYVDTVSSNSPLSNLSSVSLTVQPQGGTASTVTLTPISGTTTVYEGIATGLTGVLGTDYGITLVLTNGLSDETTYTVSTSTSKSAQK